MNKRNANRTVTLVLLFSFVLSAAVGQTYVSASENMATPTQVEFNDVVIKDFSPTRGVINSSNRNIVYFVQVSDVHVQMDAPESISNFQKFCSETMAVVDPAFLIATGDTVEGQELPNGQHEQTPVEYQAFINCIDSAGLRDRFFAAIGNHETYQSKNRTFFQTYIYPDTQYQIQMKTSFGTYQFIVIDDVKSIGLRNPFNLFGEMKNDKLNNLEKHINAPGEFNQTLLFAHIPILHTRSEKSDSGKTFRDLVDESGSPAIFTGHVHFRPIYAKPDNTFDCMAAAFISKQAYRIIAIDNDIYSFSEEIMDVYPAVTITTPTDSTFYHPNTRVDRLIDQNEIRVLIFDPKSVISTDVKIDGKSIGSLTNAGDNLWVLPYNPQDYAKGAHELTVTVETESGETVRTHSFNLEDTTATPIKGIYKLVNGTAFETVLWTLIAILTLIAITNVVIGQLWKKFKPESFEQYNLETFDTDHNLLKRLFVKNHIKAGQLDLVDTIILLALPLYVFIGPIIIAPLYFDEWGVLWFNKVTIGGDYIISLYGLIYPFCFLWGIVELQNFYIRNVKITKRPNIGSLFLPFVLLLVYVWVLAKYFSFWMIFANPAFYVLTLAIVYAIYNALVKKKYK